ncbi:MAG TPA: hypothetical protein VHO25_23395 [Polyangiaceae bacterium]|nr:hypothetical protein [Polyangiaceae bacterium]
MSQGQDPSNFSEPASVVRNERQALAMAVVVFLVALGSWGSAQFACNKRPTQYKVPTPLTTEQLSGTAKDAAIELQQRELGGDLEGALELADGPLLDELKARLAQCKAAGNCTAKAEVVTRAEVLRVEGPSVMVRTLSLLGGKETRALLKLERRGQRWRAVERSAE